MAALIAYTLSREDARMEDGVFVPLHEQDTAKWNAELIQRAGAYLVRAKALDALGRFQLEAAIQAVHVDRMSTGITNWPALVQLHLGLSHLAPTIGASVGYAAALGQAAGPEEGLQALRLIDEKVRKTFAPAQATQAHLLQELGNIQDAAEAYDRAIVLTVEPALRRYLERKRAELGA